MQCENKETTKHQPANHVRGAYLSRCVRDGAAIITDGPVLSTVTLQLLCASMSRMVRPPGPITCRASRAPIGTSTVSS